MVNSKHVEIASQDPALIRLYLTALMHLYTICLTISRYFKEPRAVSNLFLVVFNKRSFSLEAPKN